MGNGKCRKRDLPADACARACVVGSVAACRAFVDVGFEGVEFGTQGGGFGAGGFDFAVQFVEKCGGAAVFLGQLAKLERVFGGGF